MARNSRIEVETSQIIRYRDSEGNNTEPVSNFSLVLLGSIHVESGGGGPGLLIRVQRYPDDMQK